MTVRTTMIKMGVWEVPIPGTRFKYRVCTTGRTGRDWTIFKQKKELVLRRPEDMNPDAPKWEYVETGYKSKASAVEMVAELATRENFNPVEDHLNNIDDGVDLNAEGY